MHIIRPTAITDAMLISSTVSETEYPEWVSGTAYAIGDKVLVTSTGIHKAYECLVAQESGIVADLFTENFLELSTSLWTNINGSGGGALPTISPSGQLKLHTTWTAGLAASNIGGVVKLNPPNTFTLEIKTYLDAIGNYSDLDHFELIYGNATWGFQAWFSADGLFIVHDGGAVTMVGLTDIVKHGTSAAWQTWRFQINKTIESSATVEVFLKEEGGTFSSQGTVDCDYMVGPGNGIMSLKLYGQTTEQLMVHVDYIKLATGLGRIITTDETPVGNTNWLELGASNRWRCFDGIASNQATSILGAAFESDCSTLVGWTIDDVDTGVTEVSPAGQFRFDTNLGAAGGASAGISRVIGSPQDQFIIKVKTYFDALGSCAAGDYASITYKTATWVFAALFSTEGLSIVKDSLFTLDDAGAIVKYGASAALQEWEFHVDKTAGEASATVEVFLDGVSQGTYQCALMAAGVDGTLSFNLQGLTTDNMVCHVDSISVIQTIPAINYVLKPGLIDSIALLNLDADSVNITVTDPTAGEVYNVTTSLTNTIAVADWSTYFFEPITWNTDFAKTDFALNELPLYPNASVSITITKNSGIAKCGEIIVGKKFEIGALKYAPQVGITDYSTVNVDTFGNVTMVVRAYAKRMSGSLTVKNAALDEIIRQLAQYRQTPVVWVGHTNYSCLIIYGFYKNFEATMSYPNYTVMALEVQGLI